MKEHNYEFKKRLLQVHEPDRKNNDRWTKIKGTVVDDEWEIIIPKDAGMVLDYVAHDLQDYFNTSLDVYPHFRRSADINAEIAYPKCKIILATKTQIKFCELASLLVDSNKAGAYKITVGEGIVVCGATERGAAQGSYYIEDVMNLNEGPVIPKQEKTREPYFAPRMTHSGYQEDVFPTEYLKKIAHAGMDTVLLFTKGLNKNARGQLCDINDLVRRAAGVGIDVYAYSYIQSTKHPDDPDARVYYEGTYGELFANCPGIKGIVFVGESIEFPSKDKRTTGRSYRETTKENNPENKPSPGWFPCSDYPQWVNLLKDVIRSKNPDADFVFWSYNWGSKPVDLRLELIRNLPADITLLVTYEMFEITYPRPNVSTFIADYSIQFEGPGYYFRSEAEEAHKNGIKLYAMSNTGGMTWDVGDVGFIPTPQQWNKRYDTLLESRRNWDLSGLMESHHYGFEPSFISELAKWRYWSESLSFDEALWGIAVRDYGEINADAVIRAWDYYSEGIRCISTTGMDQYGCLRIGPSNMLTADLDMGFPFMESARHGKSSPIYFTMYFYDIRKADLLAYEIDNIQKMAEFYRAGNEIFEKVLPMLTGRKYNNAYRLYCLGMFIEKTARALLNAKYWHIMKCILFKYSGLNAGYKNYKAGEFVNIPANLPEGAVIDRKKLLDAIPKEFLPDGAGASDDEMLMAMLKVAKADIENAKDTLPFVDANSRLGWEPTMEYVGDRRCIEWKIATMPAVMERLEKIYYEKYGSGANNLYIKNI